MFVVNANALLQHACINAAHVLHNAAPRHSAASRYWFKQSVLLFSAAAYMQQLNPSQVHHHLQQLDEAVADHVQSCPLFDADCFVAQA